MPQRLTQQLRTIRIILPPSPEHLSLGDLINPLPATLIPDAAKALVGEDGEPRRAMIAYATHDRAVLALRTLSEAEGVEVEMTSALWAGNEPWRWCNVMIGSGWGRTARDIHLEAVQVETTMKRGAEGSLEKESAKRSRFEEGVAVA